jgi:small-conductance mechanosensitive channel
MNDITSQIIITVATLLIALGVGLFLRYLLVRRLKKTVLDNWLIQILGFFVIIPLIIVGIIVIPLINHWPSSEITNYWNFFAELIHAQDYKTLISNLIWSTVIIVLAIGVGRTLVKIINGKQTENHLNINVRTLLGRATYVGTLIIAFFFILFIWNIQFGIPAAVISVITVGLTFVLQDLLKNVVAGIYLLVEGPFHIGDEISTDVYTGKVEDVQLRATKLRIVSGEQVIVPNSMLFSGIVVNKTIYPGRRATILITLPLDKYDQDQTTECILKTIKGVTDVMIKPEPTLSLSGVAGAFGSSTGTLSGYTGEIITLTLRFWIPEGRDTPVSEAMLALRNALPYADLSIREPAGLL